MRLESPSLLIAGVDEAGRGPLAGPVVVAAVILDHERPIIGIRDSKQLNEKQRERLYEQIVQQAMAYTIVSIEPEEIDRLNIYQATLRGMRDALVSLAVRPDIARIDGNALPRDLPCRAEAWVGGDSRCLAIGAASILAKVSRDRQMVELDSRHPRYGFAKHKGYPTPEHLQALRQFGACPEHRKSFAPVREAPVQSKLW
ncbi:MAG: ribonuclease HII [Xanthomonadales bacterium]|nr:ribonuclease HII [Xanthomonadales bacterium]